jgi:hypothetical protein
MGWTSNVTDVVRDKVVAIKIGRPGSFFSTVEAP